MERGSRRLPLALPGLTLVLVAGVMLVGRLDTARYQSLLQEDGWAEWATFLTFVAAACLGFAAVRGAATRVEALVLLALSAFCLFVAGEEISWGQRLLGFRPPDVFLEHNYQQESNLHNLLKDVLDTRWLVLMISAGYGVVAPLGVWAMQRLRHGPGDRHAWLRTLSPALVLLPGFAAVAWLEFSYPLPLTGELAELALGLCFLGDLSLRAGKTTQRGTARALSLAAASMVVATLLPAGVDAWTGVGGQQATQRAQGELEQLAEDLRTVGVVQTSLRSKRRVHKRIFTATRAGYLQFGDRSQFLNGQLSPAESPEGAGVRRDARGYFMDPWLQPYWLCYQRVAKDRGRIFLYSFGANRRRDTPIRSLTATGAVDAQLQGDDVGVILEVLWP